MAAVAGMEFVAWAAHKYLMHGPLWDWHEDHHKPHHEKEGFFEKNDRFFLVFAIPSMICYIIGSLVPAYHWLFFVGVGISIYGLIYFLIHDVYIHRRFKWLNNWTESIPAPSCVRTVHTTRSIPKKNANPLDCYLFTQNFLRSAVNGRKRGDGE
ncbi:MAG: sterol desaturase family protein [Flavobacterium sp.]|nr:sterol desaturase family protein [Flavobacterium sp.]